jgi:hypothetical protein
MLRRCSGVVPAVIGSSNVRRLKSQRGSDFGVV